MSSNEDKHQKKSKRSFISKLPSFRRKKNPSPETTPSKLATRPKKLQKNENSSNAKASITKETQTPKHTPKFQDKSTSRINEEADACLATLKEEEQNGNNQTQRTPMSILNTTSAYATTNATSFTNPVYGGNRWSPQNQNDKKKNRDHVNSIEINANIREKSISSTDVAPLSPVKTTSYQHVARSSSVASTLSSGSSLSLSSPGTGSLTKLYGGPKPYRSIFNDEPRGVKRQGSTPSDVEFGSSCVSVSGSISSLSPTVEDVATKVTVRSGSVPGLHKYPHPHIAPVLPVASLSPGLSPKHSHGNSRREGAYTYDSSGCDSEDGSKTKTLTRDLSDVTAAQQTSVSPTSIVNLNFDLQTSAAASPLLNGNVERQKSLASKTKRALNEPSHINVELTLQQEGPSNVAAVREEALISQGSAAAPSSSLTNNNPDFESKHETSIPTTETHTGSDTRSSPPRTKLSAILCSTPSNIATSTPGQSHENSDQALLTRVRSVTSPVPIKTPRTFFPPQHLHLSAMRNKLRSESFDSSDLDSLASDDLMCEADTFVDHSDESFLTHGSSSMPGEHSFPSCPNSAKGKRLRNNSIEFLVASFDKRHRHHSTGESPRSYTPAARGSLTRLGSQGSQGTGRDTVVLEAGTYRQMVQDLNSMKIALVRLGKMLQDPKALSEMLAVSQQGKETEMVTMDSMTQCELISTTQGLIQTEPQVLPSSSCEVSIQCDGVQKADQAVQMDTMLSECIQCGDCFKVDQKQDDPDTITNKKDITTHISRDACLSLSSSSSGGDGEEGCLDGGWKGSSGLDQAALSPLGNSHSSGDTSDDSMLPKSVKPPRKHVRISDGGSDGSYSCRPKIPSPRVSSLPRMRREKPSSSDESSQGSISRLKQPTVRFGLRSKSGSQRSGKDLSSSDEGSGSRSRLVCRRRNQSDSSHEGSEDSEPVLEKTALPQMRRPVSKMQRPRQIQRPKSSQQQGRRQEGTGGSDLRGLPPVNRVQKPFIQSKRDPRPQPELPKSSQLQDQQANLEWQQLQLKQQHEKLQKQQVAARKQHQENQHRLMSQQQQLQKDQQERNAANLQHQQDILVKQQQQQLERQQHQQQQWQQHQQRSLESTTPKTSRQQGVVIKQSSNQDLTFAQRRAAEAVRAGQEHWHSSPNLIDNQVPSSPHTYSAMVHSTETKSGQEVQKSKSRLPAPSSISSRLPTSRQIQGTAVKREVTSSPQIKNIANGIPIPRSKMVSPKSPRRSIPVPSGNVSKLPGRSPSIERRGDNAVNSRQGAIPLHSNQNNSPSVPATHQNQTTTFTTTVTTITTTVMPQTSNTHTSKLPSPSKSNLKPVSRLAQPKVKVQSRIPKGPSVQVKGREAN